MAEHASDKTYSYKNMPVTAEGVGEDWYLVTAATAEAAYNLNNADCKQILVKVKKDHNGSAQSAGTHDARIALSSGETADSNPYEFLEPGDYAVIMVGNISSGNPAFYHKRDGSSDVILLVKELQA